jgi:hypothetical protein
LITFTERFINDSIYDGVEELEASFLSTEENYLRISFAQNPNSDKVEYYDSKENT